MYPTSGLLWNVFGVLDQKFTEGQIVRIVISCSSHSIKLYHAFRQVT